MKYKALMCDVDGTLIPNREDGLPSDKVVTAISKISSTFPVGIATARSYWQLTHIFDLIPFSAPCIITGGAQIINPKTRKTFIEHSIAHEDIQKVVAIGSSMGISFIIADRDGERPLVLADLPQKPLDMYTNQTSHKNAEEFMQKISHISTVSAHKALAWGDSDNVVVTVGNPRSSKNEGVLEVAKLLQIETHEVIAVGEGYNDFPFLLSAGLKVAMGNAVQEIKSIADYVAPSVEEDGVVDVIEKFIIANG